MKKIRDIFSGNEGFTLIELLIVIVIIGVLAAIAIPNIAGLGDSANVEAIRANMRTLMVEIESFRAQGGDITSVISTGNGFSDFSDTTIDDNTFTFSGAEALDNQVDTTETGTSVNITVSTDGSSPLYDITVNIPEGSITISDGSITSSGI